MSNWNPMTHVSTWRARIGPSPPSLLMPPLQARAFTPWWKNDHKPPHSRGRNGRREGGGKHTAEKWGGGPDWLFAPVLSRCHVARSFSSIVDR